MLVPTMSTPSQDGSGRSTVSRRQLFLVAAALAGTALTGAAAVAGLAHRPSAPPGVPAVGQTVSPITTPTHPPAEPGD
jgi:hypothetical protein